MSTFDPMARQLATLALIAAFVAAACNTPSGATSSAFAEATTAPSPAASPRASAWDVASVRQAALTTVGTGSASLLLSISFEDSSTISSGTRLRTSGVTTFGPEVRQSFQLDADSVQMGVIEFIVLGSKMYMRGRIMENLGAPRGKWVLIDLASESEVAREFATIAGDSDASLLIYYLLGATEPVTVVGSETIDGVATSHVSFNIDMDQALANVPDDARDALTTNIAEQRANGVDPIVEGEAWIDGDGHVRRVAYTFGLSNQSGGGTMSAVIDLSDLGAPVDIDEPGDADVVSIEDLGQ